MHFRYIQLRGWAIRVTEKWERLEYGKKERRPNNSDALFQVSLILLEKTKEVGGKKDAGGKFSNWVEWD